jgi:HD-like signal output (HDOD) protein
MAQPEEKTDAAARDQLLNLDQLPPLSLATTRLIEVASDPDLEIRELASIIEQDPPLTARVLGIANSAFYGQRVPIVNVERAIVQVLGLDQVRNLSLVMALAGSFNTRRCANFDPADYWLRAVLTAALAAAVGRRLCDEVRCPVDALYLCGLLHNIGVLMLVHVRPGEMSEVFARARDGNAADQRAVERSLLGVDHRQAGEWLAYRWGLPGVVVHALAYTQDPAHRGEHAGVVAILRAASQWTDDYLNATEPALSIPGVDAADSSAVEQELGGRIERLRALAGAFAQRSPA